MTQIILDWWPLTMALATLLVGSAVWAAKMYLVLRDVAYATKLTLRILLNHTHEDGRVVVNMTELVDLADVDIPALKTVG